MNGLRSVAHVINWRRLAQLAFIFLLAAAVLFLFAHHAHADATQDASKCKDYPGLTNKIAACIRLTLADVANTYFYGTDGNGGFYGLVKDAIYGFMTLGVAIYGVLIAAGMIEKFSRDMIVLAAKVGCIAFFTTNLDYVYNWEISMMDAVSAAVVTFVPQSGAIDGQTQADQLVCMKKMEDQAAVPTTGDPVVAPWLAMDCIVDSVIGLKKSSDTNGTKYANPNLQGEGMARGMVAFFFSSAKTSVMGLLIAVLGFIFVYSLVFLIIKALFTYIGGYIGLTFLTILGPIFIPLILFRPTKEYFDKWLKMIISFMLQPVLMLIFITMTIAAVDLVAYSGDYSIMYKIAGDASRQPSFSLNQYLKDKNITVQTTSIAAYAKSNRTNPQVTAAFDKGVIPSFTSGCTHDKNQTDTNCGHDYPLQFWHDSIDWQKLADSRSPAVQIEGDAKTTGEEISREVLSALIFAGVVIFVMNGLLAVVPMVANDLIADYGVSPNLFSKMGRLPFQDKATAAVRDMVGNLGASRKGGPQ